MFRTAILATAFAAAPASAATTIIDFDQFATTYTSGAYVEDGYSLRSSLCSTTCFRAVASDLSIDPDGTSVVRAGGGTSTIVERLDGGVFQFQSIDFGKTSTTSNTASSTYEFVFTLAGTGQTVSRFFSFNWNNPSPVTTNTATFAGIGDITRFTFRNASSAAQFDNLTLTSVAGVVPEPATWAMMLGGVGLIGGTMRRRSAKVRYAA